MRVLIPRDPAMMAPAGVYGAAREESGRAALDAQFVVTYRANDAFGVWVPSEMTEIYLYGAQYITASAKYSNFRRFQVITDETVKVPK